ncbi:unnamed protein product [Mytilus edulis]|uniref:MACPF domain-containing protein n=1 Tax=Mytilus edulis TaxID=6550 RepID=A0A8S3U7E4_MYTED|nr:unnamed protein product [Mytilus edulis]
MCKAKKKTSPHSSRGCRVNAATKTEKYESMEFSTKTNRRPLTTLLNIGESKQQLGTGIGFGIFSIDIGYAHGETSETKTQNSSLSAFTEVKDMVVVSTATFSLRDVKHSISDEAMDELRKIEAYQGDDRKDGLRSFLKEFGSHYYTGTFTFGGIFNRSVECRREKKMSQSDTLNLVKNGLQLSISGMYEEFAGSAAISGK